MPDIALSQCSLIEQMNDYDVLRAKIYSHDICITRYIWEGEDIYKRVGGDEGRVLTGVRWLGWKEGGWEGHSRQRK